MSRTRDELLRDALLLTKASQADVDRKGLEVASALVAASLAPDDMPFVERLHGPFPWLSLLKPSEQAAFATEIVDVARGCAAVSRFEQLLITLEGWLASAEAVAAGYTPDDQLDWLQTAQPAPSLRG